MLLNKEKEWTTDRWKTWMNLTKIKMSERSWTWKYYMIQFMESSRKGKTHLCLNISEKVLPLRGEDRSHSLKMCVRRYVKNWEGLLNEIACLESTNINTTWRPFKFSSFKNEMFFSQGKYYLVLKVLPRCTGASSN